MGDEGDCPGSPPLARGAYNFNFDELDDSMDPFKSSGGLSNSPSKDIGNPFRSTPKMASSPPRITIPEPVNENHRDEAEALDEIEDVADTEDMIEVEETPFATKNKMAQSPAMDKGDPFKTKTKLAESPAIDIEDPFIGKSKIVESPAIDIEDPFKTKSKIVESPAIHVDIEDPFKTKTKIAESPAIDIEDPFKTKSKIVESPAIHVDIEDPFKTKTKIAESPAIDIEDPFKTKTNITDSPCMNIEESPDPVKTKTNIAESPAIDIEDPFKTKSKIVESPAIDIEDPFKTKNKIAESPAIDIEDTFKSKTNIADSPAMNIEDPFKTKTEIAESPAIDIEDPFKTKSKIVESPAIDMEDPFRTLSKIAESPALNVEDPFKTKSKIAESPALNVEDPFKTKSKIAESPAIDIEDPFKTKTNITDSPAMNIEDPFNTKSKVVASPAIDMEEPFKTKSKIANSPAMNIEDPFKTKSKIAIDMKDPFKTRSKIADSPEMNIEDPFKTKTKLGQSLSKSDLPMDDPFQSKRMLGNSPTNGTVNAPEDHPFQSHNKPGVSPPMENNNMQEAYTDSENRTADKAELEKSNKGLKTRSKSRTPPTTKPVENSDQFQTQNNIDQDVPIKPKPEKKATSLKKSGIKKPKARSKFKPPANFGVQDSEDVVIFAPPPPSDNTQSANDINHATSSQLPPESRDGEELCNKHPIRNEIDNSSTNRMTTSEMIGRDNVMIDSVHDFGAGEMPMESNEAFVPASEAFDEDEAWEMMEKMKDENGAPMRDSLAAFDPLLQEQVPDKVTRSISDPVIEGNSPLEDEDLLLMNTPPTQKHHSGSSRGVARHPAARALQEHVDGDGAPREAHIVDKMLFSPMRGEDGKPRLDGERYFDAPEYPQSSQHKAQHKKKSKGESEVERMNAANKKHVTNADMSQDNIVQLVQVLKYSQSDWNKMKQELELDFNARVLNKEREWSRKLADRDKKITYLDEQSLLLRSANEDMKCVVTEFEKTIAQLQAEKEKSTTESQHGFEDVVSERDQALDDLQSVETAFSDLHQRYERTKGVVEGFKKNEDVLKKCVQDYQSKLKAAEDKTVSVRQQAEDKLAQASDEMDRLRKVTTSEVARLDAALKKAELKIQGLDRSLEQKIQENCELTAICDELIAKVGGD